MTIQSPEYRALNAITGPPKVAYGLLHGYSMVESFHSPKSPRIAWERAIEWRDLLLNFDWLFFTGCDAMITNPAIKLESLIDQDSDFIFAVDAGGLQSDSWLMRRCQATIKMLDYVVAQEGRLANEQDALSLYLAQEPILSNFVAGLPDPIQDGGAPASEAMVSHLTASLNRSPVRCKILPQRAMNAYDLKHYHGTGLEAHSWHPGDFILHMPGKSLEYRLTHMKAYLTP